MKTYKEFKSGLSEAVDMSKPIADQELASVDTIEKGGIYRHTQTGDFVIPTLKRVSLRGSGSTSPSDWWLNKHWSNVEVKAPDPIGWFATKDNIAHGWAIYELSKYDKAWLKTGGVLKTNGIVRISSYKGTTLAKFNLKSGVWSVATDYAGEPKNEKGEITFDKPTPYNRLILDTQDAFESFGFTFKIK